MDTPKTLDEAIDQLEALVSKEDIPGILKNGEVSFRAIYHMGMGRGIRNNWGLWTGGPLKDWFKDRGIQHADDMSGIIFTCLYRKLAGLPRDLETQIEEYRAHWVKSGVDPDTMKEKT